MPPRSPGANAVTKTSGSAAAAGRGASIMARAARAKARAQRSVVIGKLLGVGTVRHPVCARRFQKPLPPAPLPEAERGSRRETHGLSPPLLAGEGAGGGV